ncbi:MAG TPA: choice-of-anchor D domain-containing protein, partial [Actinomycetales bacterium]|nr:choice-of-anchor D domain-containing protein [Actinomycetales bacterium]
VDPADPCLAGATAPDGTQPASVPSNFPEEAFYYAADAEIDTLPGGNKLVGVFHLEGAFGGATGGPVKGEQIVFGRMQFKATGGLVSGASYTITHPYGVSTYVADSSGSLLPTKTPTREEVGCGATPPACDFSVALGSNIAKNFLLPADPASAPPGFIGDGATEVPVTGSPTGNNFMSIVGPNVNASTNLFTLAGKLAGPLMSTPRELNFGNQAVFTTSAAKTVTLTNPGTQPVTITSARPGGTDYTVTNGTRPCIGVILPSDGECDLNVTYSPVVIAAGTDSITVASTIGTTAQKPFAVKLAGTGITAGTGPTAALSKTTVDFGEQRVGTVSDVQTVRLSNGGTAPLNVFSVKITGTAVEDFTLAGNTCTAVAPGASCTIETQFAPQRTPGVRTASLVIDDDAPGAPHTVALKGQAFGGLVRVSPTLDPGTGFPTWYEDAKGRRLEMCDDFGDVNCLADTTAPNPGDPSVPDNFGDEAFFWAGDSTVDIAGGNKAVLTMATEGAFGGATGLPATGDQITFGRLQFRVTGGLQPNTAYKITHPYGVDTVTTNASGAIPAATTPGARIEVGCGVTPPACDFGSILGTRVGPWLTMAPGQDPTTVPAAPKGYIADPNVDTKVVGSPFNTNFFQIDGPDVGGQGVSSVRTDLFTLAGKSAGPVVAEPSDLDFLDQEVGTASAAQTVTLTNLSAGAVTISGVSSDSADFAQTSTTCGTALAKDASCTVDVTFTPTAAGVRKGTLTVDDSALTPALTIPVIGTGLVATTAPNASVDTSGLVFDGQRIGTTSAAQTVTLQNSGDANLKLSSATVTGDNAADFVKGPSNCPAIIVPGASCTTDVKFKPVGAGLRSAALTFTDNSGNVAGATQDVPLSGNGTEAVATLTPASVTFDRTLVNGNATPAAVTLTNTGSASLTVSDVAIAGTNGADFGVTSNDCTATGVSLAPGASCTVKVGFSPTSLGTKTASLVFTDNGKTTTQSVSLSGVAGDPLPPTVSAPVQNFTEAGMPLQVKVTTPLANSTVPIAVRWSQTNSEPLDHYELQKSDDGGATWTAVALADPTATSARVDLRIGANGAVVTHMFRVRGYGTAGTDRIGAWATGQRVPLKATDNTNSAAVKFSGSWTAQTLAGAYGGTVQVSTATGANASLNKASFTVTGNVALISTTGPNRGRVQISVDGVNRPGFVDLYAPTQGTARVPVAVDNLPAGTHTVTVTVLSTRNASSTGNRVDIDGWGVIG